MGKLDLLAKRFFGRPEIFAALFNGYLFGGKKVLLPEELQPQMPQEVFSGDKNQRLFFGRERDLFMKVACKRNKDCSFLLLGLEAQSFPDSSMPVRCMLYDALSYSMQLKDLRREQEKSHPNARAFLDGLPEGARLTPVITLVLALTDKPWPQERELHDILALPDGDLARYIPNYRIHLITPGTMSEEDLRPYGEGLEAVLLAARHASDWKAFKKVTTSHDFFQALDNDTACLIMEIIGMNLKINDKREKINMTEQMNYWEEFFRQEGIEEGIEKGIEKGERRGVIFTLRKLGKSLEEISEWLSKYLSLTEQQAKQEVANYLASHQEEEKREDN